MTDDNKEKFDKKRRSLVLQGLRGRYLLYGGIVLFNLLISAIKATSFDFIIWVVLVGLVISALFLTFQEKYPKYIYAYSLNEENLILFLVTPLGREITVPIPVNTIYKIKNRRHYLWLYMTGEVREYYLYDILYGQELLYKLNVEKI